MTSSWELLSNGFTVGFDVTLIPVIITLLTIGRFGSKRVLNAVLPHMKQVSEKTRSNVIDSMFYVGTIIFSLSLGEYATRNAQWRLDYEYCFRGFPFAIEESLKLYYTYCFSFYLFWLACVLFVDEKKKDHAAMITHHVATIVVVFISGSTGMHRIGTIIMLTFDLCDVMLEMAKICNRTKQDEAAAIFFVLFVVSWIKYRMYDYPLYVLTAIYNATPLAGTQIVYDRMCFYILLCIFALQVYWSYFILKKLQSLITKGIKGDEGDPREAEMKPKKH